MPTEAEDSTSAVSVEKNRQSSLCLFELGSHSVSQLDWNSLCSPDWPQTLCDPPASASRVENFAIFVQTVRESE